MGVLLLVLITLVLVLVPRLWRAWVRLVWKPRAIAKRFREQGVVGPEYKFLIGSLGEIKQMRDDATGLVLDINCHDFTPIIQPQYRKWISLYGRTFLFWYGSSPALCVADIEKVKQLLSDRSGHYLKNVHEIPDLDRLLGKGVPLTDGEEWKRRMRVVYPAFNTNKVKMMQVTMTECARSMLSDWEAELGLSEDGSCEMDLGNQLEELTADVITHTAFGSSSKEGKEVFLAQRKQQHIVFSSIFKLQIPGFRYLPTENNRQSWNVDKKIRNMLMQIVKGRIASKDTAGYGNDLLGLMLEASSAEGGILSMDEIIDECKTFYFAGHDTTAHLLTWTMFLLSIHQEWQEKLRDEVLSICGSKIPDNDMIEKFNLVTMVFLETLRLYSPIALMERKAGANMELGDLKVPEGTILSIPIATLHRDKEVWGEDADKFNPLRFENGLYKAAKHPNAWLSFSQGMRSCIGQKFALIEAKSVLAMILQRFTFSISPKYVHAPIDVLTVRPKFGLPVVLRRL